MSSCPTTWRTRARTSPFSIWRRDAPCSSPRVPAATPASWSPASSCCWASARTSSSSPWTRWRGLGRKSSATGARATSPIPAEASSVSRDADHGAPEVLSPEQASEHSGRGLQSVDDVLAVAKRSVLEPPPQLRPRLTEARGVVEHHEALHAQPLDDEERRVLQPRARLRGHAVVRDEPRHHHPALHRHARERRVQRRATHVVQVHAHALGTLATDGGRQILFRAIVDAGIEAQ